MKPAPRIFRAPLALAATAALVATATVPAARADDWVVRPVRLGTLTGPSENVDVLLQNGGDVAIGYTLGGDPNLYLSALPAGQPFFQHQSSSAGYLSAAFAADASGMIDFVAAASGGLRAGTVTGGWGLGTVSSLLPNSGTLSRTRLPSIAVDSHGIPAFVTTDLSTQRVFSRFDVPSGTWVSQTLPGSATSFVPYVQSALAYTPDDRAIVAYVNPAAPQSPLVVAIQIDSTGWRTFTPATLAAYTRGVSVATSPDGRIGVAYTAFDGTRVATFDGTTWSSSLLSPLPSNLEPHSLTVDANGSFALAYAPRASTSVTAPVHLARLGSDAIWADETLPVSGWWASATFDADNHPYLGVYDGSNVLLAGKTILTFRPNDFNFDNAVTADDVPNFAQALHHPDTFTAAHPPLTPADLVAIGDHNGDVRLTVADARGFIESLTTSPVPGLPDRTAGYLAFDQADLDPAVGSGTGNFFGTSLSTAKPYTPGASRYDVSGPNPGTADNQIGVPDVEYLHTALLPGTPTPPTDIRLDINGDGAIDAADLHALVHDVLGTTEGDANLDGRIDPDDFALVDRGFAGHLTGWSDGDFNLDGQVTPDDYLLLDTAFAQQTGTLSPTLLAERRAEFGDAYVSELLASVPEPASLGVFTALAGLLCPRRRRVI